MKNPNPPSAGRAELCGHTSEADGGWEALFLIFFFFLKPETVYKYHFNCVY